MPLTNLDARKSSFVVEKDRKGRVTRVISPNKLEVGTSNQPQDLDVTGDLDWQGRALAQSYKSSSTALTTGFADIPFETDEILNDIARPATDQFQVPRKGKYMIAYFVAVTEAAASDSVLLVRVRTNDSTVITQSDAHAGQNPAVGREGVGHTFIAQLNANDFITLQARVTVVGVAQSIGGATEERSSLMIVEL